MASHTSGMMKQIESRYRGKAVYNCGQNNEAEVVFVGNAFVHCEHG
jgi:hypothetical protein